MEKISNKTCFEEQSKFCKIIFCTLEKLGQKPIDAFTAVAGRDYGFVEAYRVHSFEFPYIIKYGDKVSHSYYACDNLEDLDVFLYPHDLSFFNYAVKKANLKGIDTIIAASEDEVSPFYVLVTRRYVTVTRKYLGYTAGVDNFDETREPQQRSDAARDEHSNALEFDNIEDARAWLAVELAKPYKLERNESDYLDYKIISKHSCGLNLG